MVTKVIYETHWKFPNEEGWRIRFVEGDNSKAGRQASIDHAFESTTWYMKEVTAETEPKLSRCIMHKEWPRKIRKPVKVSGCVRERGPKRRAQMENGLEVLEAIGLY